MKAAILKKEIKDLGASMAGGFSLKAVAKKTSYYSFTQEGDTLFLTLNLNEARSHWHRDRQRFARLVRFAKDELGVKGAWYEDGSFGFDMKASAVRKAG